MDDNKGFAAVFLEGFFRGYRINNSHEIKITKREKSENMTPVYEAFVAMYHQYLPELPRIEKLSEKRKRLINARWKEHKSYEFWEEYFYTARDQTWLIGDNQRGWRANFEWLLIESNFIKVLEKYYKFKEGDKKK